MTTGCQRGGAKSSALAPVRHAGFYRRYGKRWLDLALASAALVVLMPLLALLALLVRWRLGRPILFRQQRVGENERIFRLLKFRTMTDARDGEGRLLPDSDRLTPFGLFLRRWSLDELPQLLNVLRGDLSLVGPRPLLVRYLPRYSAWQRLRHAGMPGITGWAQINGRNLLAWDQRFEHDIWYLNHCNLWLDLTILLHTIGRFFGTDNTLASCGVELQEFWGNEGRPSAGPHSFPSEETEAHDLRPGR